MVNSSSLAKELMLKLFPVLRIVAQVFYSLLKLLPMRNRLLLMTRRNVTSSLDFQLIEDYVAKECPGVEVVVMYHPMGNKVRYLFTLVQELYYLATSKWAVTDSYQISISLFPLRRGVRVAQVWHSLGAIKQFGRLTVGLEAGSSEEVANLMKMHENYSVVAAPSSATADVFAKGFGVPREIVEVIGSPRIDYLVSVDRVRARQELAQKYNLDPERPIYLYAPTFRDNATVPVAELVEALQDSNAQLMLQIHPRDAQTVGTVPGLIVSREPELLRLLAGADGMITDYSGAVYEAGILGVPVAFWAYDIEAYRHSPGFTLDFESELADLITQSPADAIALLDEQASVHSDGFARFMDTYIETRDDQNCRRLAMTLGLPLKGAAVREHS